MSTKIRKQIYLEKRQDRLVKRLADARGVSEAEVIRQAIDREAGQRALQPAPLDFTALEAFIQCALERGLRGSSDQPYNWNRDDAYEERLRPFNRRAVDDSD
jgi:hypothetical protein